jgi:hypothetical protein
MMRRFVNPALLLLLPLAFFLSFFHPAILCINNPGWLLHGSDHADNGEGALGSHAYWHDSLAGLSLRTTLLNAPEGVPVLYTDSNPLVTLAAKPFATLLPADAQLVGPCILLSLILQAVFAWLLLRRHAPGPLALWAGVALLAYPPTLANRFLHFNLMAHWTILAALCLFLDAKRGRQLRWWALLIAITTLIHSYLLVMVGAIWASSIMLRFAEGPGRMRLITLGHVASVLGLIAGIAWWLGVGDPISTGTFGEFSMPIDALWNPGIDQFSNLLPPNAHGAEGWFEGFQYLGAGGLVLMATAVVIQRYCPSRESDGAILNRLRGLAPALIVLAMLAIVRLSLPAPILAMLDPVRASGRLFWPVGYVLVLIAVLIVFRLSAQRAGLMLIGIIALQVIDLAGMANIIRAQSQEAGRHRLYGRTLDPRWDLLIRQSQSIAFIPGDVTGDLNLFQEIAWRAVKEGHPVANVYAARTNRVSVNRLNAEGAAFARGDLVPGRLYILLTSSPLPAAAVSRRLRLDGVTVIAPYRMQQVP